MAYKINSNISGIEGKYANLGIRIFNQQSCLSGSFLENPDILRALSCLKSSANAVFVSEPKSYGEELARQVLRHIRQDNPDCLIVELDAGALISADKEKAAVNFQNIIKELQESRQKVTFFVSGLAKILECKDVVSVFCGLIAQKTIAVVSAVDIKEFRALEEFPKLSGFINFILTDKPDISGKRDKTVLIVGASSLFGNAVYRIFSREYKEVSGTAFSKASSMGFDKLDVASNESVQEYFSKHPVFDIVVYIAGEANADIAEKERERARKLNVDAISLIAKYAKCGKFVYTSSEYIFDGSSGPYGSGSEAKPINYYGCTKLEGEKASKENFKNNLIIRLGALYGYNGPYDKETTVSKLIASFSKPEPLKADNVQIKHPILLEDAVNTLLKLLDYGASGIYQINGAEGLNKQEMAEKILKVKERICGIKFSYPIIGVEQPAIAAKPFNTHMVNIDTPRSFEEGIAFMLKQQGNEHERK